MRSWLSPSLELAAVADETLLRRFVEVSRRAEIAEIVNSATSEGELAEFVPEELCEAYEAEISFVLAARADGGRREVIGSVGLAEEERAQLRDDPLPVGALADDMATQHRGDDLLGVGARRVAVAPFAGRGGDRALVGVARLYERDFDDAELALLHAGAQSVGRALERAWAREELEARTSEQEAAAELGLRALKESSPEALMDDAVALAARTLEAHCAAIIELAPGGKAVPLAAFGLGTEVRGEELVGSEADSLASHLLLQGEPVIIGDRQGDARIPLPAALRARGVESGVAAAIADTDGPFGVVVAYWRGRRSLGQDRCLFLQSVANVLAAAVQRNRAETGLRAEQERLQLALRAGRMAAWEWDVTTGVVRWSSGPDEILGPASGISGGTYEGFLELLHPNDRESVRETIREALERRGDYQAEFRLVSLDGRVRWIEAKGRVVCNDAGEPLTMLGVAMDVSERKRGEEEREKLEEQLRRQALHDPLTGLPNRSLMSDRLRQALSAARRHGDLVGLLQIDLDRFKEINDSLGHEAGDEVLRRIAARLDEALRDADTIARLGGDEFAIVFSDVRSIEAAERITRRVLGVLERPLELGAVTLTLRASIGVALFPLHGNDPTSLHRRADAAMYRAKRLGGGYAVYTQSDDERRLDPLRFAARLRDAIDGGELVLRYQPVVSVLTGEVIALEGLLRWRERDRGYVLPGDFIPLAEQTGLIKSLSEWALLTALRESKSWRDEGAPIALAMNLSAQLLHDPQLARLVSDAIADTATAADQLELEITESAVMADPEGALTTISDLTSRGVRFTIDDFGTGYSSLAYLKRIPVRSIKIDQSFVRGIATDERDASIVRSAIELAHSLDITVIAEGVESRRVWDLLRDLGCDYVQGYYVARPMPSTDVAPWIRAHEATVDEQPRRRA